MKFTVGAALLASASAQLSFGNIAMMGGFGGPNGSPFANNIGMYYLAGGFDGGRSLTGSDALLLGGSHGSVAPYLLANRGGAAGLSSTDALLLSQSGGYGAHGSSALPFLLAGRGGANTLSATDALLFSGGLGGFGGHGGSYYTGRTSMNSDLGLLALSGVFDDGATGSSAFSTTDALLLSGGLGGGSGLGGAALPFLASRGGLNSNNLLLAGAFGGFGGNSYYTPSYAAPSYAAPSYGHGYGHAAPARSYGHGYGHAAPVRSYGAHSYGAPVRSYGAPMSYAAPVVEEAHP